MSVFIKKSFLSANAQIYFFQEWEKTENGVPCYHRMWEGRDLSKYAKELAEESDTVEGYKKTEFYKALEEKKLEHKQFQSYLPYAIALQESLEKMLSESLKIIKDSTSESEPF